MCDNLIGIFCLELLTIITMTHVISQTTQLKNDPQVFTLLLPCAYIMQETVGQFKAKVPNLSQLGVKKRRYQVVIYVIGEIFMIWLDPSYHCYEEKAALAFLSCSRRHIVGGDWAFRSQNSVIPAETDRGSSGWLWPCLFPSLLKSCLSKCQFPWHGNLTFSPKD